jgi:AraC-like DNA-binding protein
LDTLLFFDFNQKSSTLLVFFFNSILFSFLLLKQGLAENRKDSKWLSIFIFLCGLYICPFMLGYAGWYSIKDYREFLFFIPFQQLFLIGPVLYFYTQSLLNKGFKVSRTEIIHLLPALVYLIYSLIVFVADELFFYADGRDKDLDFWYQMSGLIFMLFYLVLSLRYYKNYRAYTIEEVSFADDISFKWIKHFMLAFSSILILRVLFFILHPEWDEFGSKYWYYLCFSILFLYIAITGYSSTLNTNSNFRFDKSILLQPTATNENDKLNSDKVTEELREIWRSKIISLFENSKVYKNSNLTLSDIAKELDTNRNIISGVINSEFQLNFNDFVNKKRTEAVINKIEQGEHLTNTLLGIALDCGFNSKTTFNRAFKKNTSITPKQYVTKMKQ